MICTGVDSVKTVTITEGTPYTFVYSTPVVLPTSTPEVPQLNYTVQETQKPLFNVPPKSCKYQIHAFVWGRSEVSSTKTVSYSVYQNDSLIVSGTYTNILNQNYWCLQFVTNALINSTDVNIKFYIWDTAGTLDIRGKAVMVYVTQPQLESNKLMYDFNWNNTTLSLADQLAFLGNTSVTSDFYYRFDTVRLDYMTAASSKRIVHSDPYAFRHYYTEAVVGTMINKVTGKNGAASASQITYTCPRYPHTMTYRVIHDKIF